GPGAGEPCSTTAVAAGRSRFPPPASRPSPRCCSAPSSARSCDRLPTPLPMRLQDGVGAMMGTVTKLSLHLCPGLGAYPGPPSTDDGPSPAAGLLTTEQPARGRFVPFKAG